MAAPCFLQTSKDYLRALRSHRRVADGGWRLCFVRGRRGAAARFGVVVAKRHVRRASARNRIRRVLREYFRQELRHSLPPMDYLMQSADKLPLPVSGEALRVLCRALFAEAIGKNHE